VDEAFNLWTDGKVGAYVRFVVDGQRFGFHPETEIAAREVKIGEDVYVCPDCGEETPSVAQAFLPVPQTTSTTNRATQAPSKPSLGSGPDDRADERNRTNSANAASFLNAQHRADVGTGRIACATCGAFLTSENFVPAETLT